MDFSGKSAIYSTLLLLAMTTELAWSHEHGEQLSSAGTEQEEVCAITETMTTTKLQAQGKPIYVRDFYGQIDSDGLSVPSGNTTWRIICPSEDYTVLTVVMTLETAVGDYLQVKNIELRAACLDTPWAMHFNKKSTLVGLIASGRSTFLLRYVCVERSFDSLAEDIFLNPDVLRYMKEHDSENADDNAFNKVAHLLQNPETILFSDSDPILSTILELADTPPPSPDDNTSSTPPPSPDGNTPSPDDRPPSTPSPDDRPSPTPSPTVSTDDSGNQETIDNNTI